MRRSRLRQRCRYTSVPKLPEDRQGELLLRARLLQAKLGKKYSDKHQEGTHTNKEKAEHKKSHKSQSNPLRNLFPPKVISEPDPATGQFNPFPTFPYTGNLRPVYPLSPRRAVPKNIKLPDYAGDGQPRSEQVFVGRRNITILNKKEQEAMRKVCRLAREVLDIAAAEVRPGITTDYLDEIVHKACLERDVRATMVAFRTTTNNHTVVPFTTKLLPLSQVGLHLCQRGHLPRHSRQLCSERWGYCQHRCNTLPRRLPR